MACPNACGSRSPACSEEEGRYYGPLLAESPPTTVVESADIEV